MSRIDVRQAAKTLGGRVERADRIRVPGPNDKKRGRNDDSLMVFFGEDKPEGFEVHSHSGDDWRECRDYVRDRLGLPSWKPDGKPRSVFVADEFVYELANGFPYHRIDLMSDGTYKHFWFESDGWDEKQPPMLIPFALPDMQSDETIWLVRGEDNARLIRDGFNQVATTFPSGINEQPDPSFLHHFAGKDVRLLHVGGAESRKFCASFSEAMGLPVWSLPDGVGSIRSLAKTEGASLDDCAVDDFEPVAPSTPADLEPEQPKPRRFKLSKLPRLEPEKIKPREWLLNNHLIRKFVSLTVSPGGLGKSSMTMIEGLSMAANRPLFDGTVIHEKRKMNVVMWNGEDPQDENMRRLYAAMKHYGVTYEEIEDTMIVESGREKQIKFANMVRGESELDEAFFVELEDELIENNTDVFVIDPFIQTHSVSENDNGAIDLVIKRLGRLADRANCAVEVVHHVRKAGTTGKAEPSMDDARGASALKDGIRSGRFLSKMPSDMAGPANLSPEDAEVTFAVTGGKGNMARITGKSVWRKMISVPLGNSDEHGRTDDVGVCVAFDMPESALPSVDMSRAQDIALAILARDDTVRYHSGRGAAPHQWLGYLMADELGVDTSTETGKVALGRIRSLIRSMINDEAIHVRRASDGKHMADYLAAGPRVDDADAPPPHWSDQDDAPF